jgi:hypothetical protein
MLVLNSGWSKRCGEFGGIDETHEDAIFIAEWGASIEATNVSTPMSERRGTSA